VSACAGDNAAHRFSGSISFRKDHAVSLAVLAILFVASHLIFPRTETIQQGHEARTISVAFFPH